MKDKPQLSAEMEKRLKFALANVFISYEALDKKISAENVEKVVQAFLATALEEQKQEILSEVEEMVKHQRLSQKDGYITDGIKRHQNSLRAEIRAKLNQLKGEK